MKAPQFIAPLSLLSLDHRWPEPPLSPSSIGSDNRWPPSANMLENRNRVQQPSSATLFIRPSTSNPLNSLPPPITVVCRYQPPIIFSGKNLFTDDFSGGLSKILEKLCKVFLVKHYSLDTIHRAAKLLSLRKS